MSDDRDKKLSDAEARAMRSLAVDCQPSAGVEDRIVTELKRRGAIRADGGWTMKITKSVVAAAIVAAAFFGGFVAGNRGATASKPAGETAAATEATSDAAGQYMLLMYSRVDPGADVHVEATGEEDYRAIVDEYRQWAFARDAEGRLVSAEKLSDETRVMEGSGEHMTIAADANSDRVLGGYFLITAPSLDDAIELAKSHPHLKYGGEIEVRPIESTN
jgi:hypothetical protein